MRKSTYDGLSLGTVILRCIDDSESLSTNFMIQFTERCNEAISVDITNAIVHVNKKSSIAECMRSILMSDGNIVLEVSSFKEDSYDFICSLIIELLTDEVYGLMMELF
jgi:hypothetical protein